MKQYIFFYFISASAEAIKKSAPNHAKYWADKLVMGGPFADFSGGFVIFEASSIEDAKQIANADPFVLDGIISDSVLKEWLSK
jgi:uncharacterized protein YciI